VVLCWRPCPRELPTGVMFELAREAGGFSVLVGQQLIGDAVEPQGWIRDGLGMTTRLKTISTLKDPSSLIHP